jgi:hypothetical protein
MMHVACAVPTRFPEIEIAGVWFGGACGESLSRLKNQAWPKRKRLCDGT